jgi:gamma-glutamylcyclotransferase (GGCT)/AIG2-like uncharacterized protein YtfP
VHTVFVYGTLMPGDCRWPLVSSEVVALRRATVRGRIFDTGFGYPGARFDLDGSIEGWVLELRRAGLEATIARLDEMEGTVHGEYLRVGVVTDTGESCWAYEIGTSVDELPDLHGVWPIRY